MPHAWVSCVGGGGEGKDTPAQLQIICIPPWRFGTTIAENANSFVHVRIEAFVSKAIFRTAIQVLKVGESVVGYVEPTNGGPKGAQLFSWETREWITRPPFSRVIIDSSVEEWAMTLLFCN